MAGITHIDMSKFSLQQIRCSKEFVDEQIFSLVGHCIVLLWKLPARPRIPGNNGYEAEVVMFNRGFS